MSNVIGLNDHRLGWRTGHASCWVCGAECVPVFREDADPSRLECHVCGHFSMACARPRKPADVFAEYGTDHHGASL